MNTKDLPLPEKIFAVEYAGFFDFNEEDIYDTSVINRDDYPNAEEIANEISKRYNNFDKMKEALGKHLAILKALTDAGIIEKHENSKYSIIDETEQLLESIK